MAAVGRISLKVRSFSTSVTRPAGSLVRPPIQVYGLEGRYATALYSAAFKEKKLDQVEKDLTRVLALVKDPKLSFIITNPHVKRSLKQKTITDIVTKEKFTPVTANFFNLLAENGRLNNTTDVINAFGKIMSAHRGEVLCSVTTSSPLDEANLTELKTALNAFLAKGESLKLETKTDPTILGGMLVSIGDKYIDMSTKTKIQKLTKIMTDTV
ncbi:ATP synthase subunit O, mitochondrial [Rana temporaria]|uniref:ATP synthase subunit O, mitochondrial n=1 Tax=Rana temporaria TaxID=8407 RepID=UPI001AAD2E77|nr:ATP synthase subunit O, mitochondrial [Rana temporaria]